MATRRLALPLLAILALLLSLLPASAVTADALPTVQITIDGVPLSSSGVVVNGSTVVPMRAIFEALGATLSWNAATRTVTAFKPSKEGSASGTTISLTIDNPQAIVNNKVVTLPVAPLIIKGSTYVPLRFVSEALNADVKWHGDTRTVAISTTGGCGLQGGQQHSGKIQPGGETWGVCGSPHFVTGDFDVSGPDSPVLTIEAGAVVRFASGASLQVSPHGEPGGLMIQGTKEKPVLLTADSGSPTPGYWTGIAFGDHTLPGKAVIQGASIEYAGDYYGAVKLDGYNGKNIQVLIKDTKITHSLKTGLNIYHGATLAHDSDNLTITGTVPQDGQGGFPITVEASASGSLPSGMYRPNTQNAVLITTNSSSDTLSKDTTWRNIGVPYALDLRIDVDGPTTPTLTIDPGVVTLWKKGTGLSVGIHEGGTLLASAFRGEAIPVNWSDSLSAAEKSAVRMAGLGDYVWPDSQQAITFAPWTTDAPQPGDWDGFFFGQHATTDTKLNGVVIDYAGRVDDYYAGIRAENNTDSGINSFLLANSLITNGGSAGVRLVGNEQLAPGSTGNTITANALPMAATPNALGSISPDNQFTGNTTDYVDVNDDYIVRQTQTWHNLGVPYHFQESPEVTGKSTPVLTIEAGTTLQFVEGHGLSCGGSEGMGSLIAVGTADKRITFTSELERPGTWDGIHATPNCKQFKLQYSVVKYAKGGLTLEFDPGSNVSNDTFESNSEAGIHRWYDGGTDLTQGLGNTFTGNGEDQTTP